MDHEQKIAAYQEEYEAQREARRRNRSRRNMPFRAMLFAFAVVFCAINGWWIAAVILALPTAYLIWRVSRPNSAG